LPLFTLGMCQDFASWDLYSPHVAIDYFASTGECLTYWAACTTPQATRDGASSYARTCVGYSCPAGYVLKASPSDIIGYDAATCCETTCADYSCPRDYVLKANAGNILGQGSDVATCCEVCPVWDCGCAVRNAVARNSAWYRWDYVTCKCAVGTSLHGDSESCTGGSRKFNPSKLWGQGCFCSQDMPSGEEA
jgi:hypothetical protein